jgi:hypothetical protein
VSAALYIVLSEANPGFESFVSGKALSHHEHKLARLANDLGVTPLMEFFSMSPADVLATFEDPTAVEPEVVAKLKPEVWFPPQDGLTTVRALVGTSELPNGVREDLIEFERVLSLAAKQGLKWHLAVDY